MPIGVYKRTEETKRKLSEAHKGKPHAEETKKKISKTKKGSKLSSEHKAKITVALRGNKNCSGKNLGNKSALGNKLSPEIKMKIGFAQIGMKNNNWKGGITPVASQIRNSSKYAQWRTDVFIRDNFTCRKCGQIGRNLEVHHVIPFADLLQEAKEYMSLFSLYEAMLFYTPIWNVGNGITLCNKCHKKFKKKGGVN